jgi:hypothetical protein
MGKDKSDKKSKKDKKSGKKSKDVGGDKKAAAARTPKKTTSESAMRNKYEKSIATKPAVKKPKDTRKVTGLKDPCAINMDAAKARDMDVEVGITPEIQVSLKRKADHAPCVHLPPLRQHQCRDTLAIRTNQSSDGATALLALEPGSGNDSDENDIVDSDVDLYKELRKTNESLYKQRNENTFPLDALVNLGLLSTQTLSLDSRQSALAAQYADSATFMRDQLKQLIRMPPLPNNTNGPLVLGNVRGKKAIAVSRTTTKKAGVARKKVKNSDMDEEGGGDEEEEEEEEEEDGPISSSIKLSGIFTPLNFKCSYVRHSSNVFRNHTCKIYDSDRERATARFFAGDSLEDDVPANALPGHFKIFQQLMASHYEKYQAREQVSREGSAQVPRSSLEEVNRAHIRDYRYRPLPGDRTCFNGTRCYFYTISSDPEVRYVGKVFRTPRQEKIEREGGTLPDTPDNALCIDCLLAGWTKKNAEKYSKERAPRHPINHFTVLVGKGEYNESCMLQNRFNNLVTGIVGKVPRYDEKNRAKDDVTLRRLGQQEATTESYIAEIGMDF